MTERMQFAVMPDGTQVDKITLRSGAASCGILTYGGTLQSFCVPDADGEERDVVLGFDELEGYQNQPYYIGGLIGRYANRIAGGRFALNDQCYTLAVNDGENHLHGGNIGFDKRIWSVECLEEDCVTLSLVSMDGDEGYPGTLCVKVTYRLDESALWLDYEAVCDQDTLCNLTNHAYFNLAGHNGAPVTEQELQIFADAFTPTDSGLIPLGELTDVSGTPMDLRQPKVIGAAMSEPFEALTIAGGYDHNWAINSPVGQLRPAACAYCKDSGISLQVETTLPGIQLFVSRFPQPLSGKSGTPYIGAQGFCLETQFYPDSPNRPQFPQAVLRAGEVWKHQTVFRFNNEKKPRCQ